jgi:hypothetical protein
MPNLTPERVVPNGPRGSGEAATASDCEEGTTEKKHEVRCQTDVLEEPWTVHGVRLGRGPPAGDGEQTDGEFTEDHKLNGAASMGWVMGLRGINCKQYRNRRAKRRARTNGAGGLK